MPQNEQDPAATTEQFRAFATQGDTGRTGINPALIVTGGVVLLVVIVVIALLVI